MTNRKGVILRTAKSTITVQANRVHVILGYDWDGQMYHVWGVALYLFTGEGNGLVVKDKIVILVLHQESEQLGVARYLPTSLKTRCDRDLHT